MSNFIENWRSIESGFEEGPLNMAIDETLFVTAKKLALTYPTLRFYGFRPNCVTFGISQSPDESTVLKKLKKEGYNLTRRPTGGGIVVHDFDLCYTVVVSERFHPTFSSPMSSYEAVHQAIFAGFRREGIQLEFAGEGISTDVADAVCTEQVVRCDLLYQGKKLAGAAERRTGGYVLHQGFVSLKPFASGRNGYFPFFEKMCRSIEEGFKDRFGASLTTGGLFPDEAREAVRLKHQKYATDDWNLKKAAHLVPT